MFGDIFHGTIVFIVGLLAVSLDNRLKVGPFKYMLLQMGFWAMFMGWVYNDFTGLSLPFFDSCFKLEEANGVSI